MTIWVERWAAAGPTASATKPRMMPIRPRMVPSLYMHRPATMSRPASRPAFSGPAFQGLRRQARARGLGPRIERVAQRIADQVDAEHDHHDGQPGEDRRPPRLPNVRR